MEEDRDSFIIYCNKWLPRWQRRYIVPAINYLMNEGTIGEPFIYYDFILIHNHLTKLCPAPPTKTKPNRSEYQATWRQEHSGYGREYRRDNPDKYQLSSFKYRLRKKLNKGLVTPEEYEARLAEKKR